MSKSKTVPALATAAALLCSTSGIALAQEDTLVIGSVIPLTGPYASYGVGLAAAMNLAVEEIEAAGGIDIELIIEDSQTDPTAGLNAARKLVDVDGVDIIVGTFASSVTLPILSYTAPAGVPVMTLSGAPEISDIGLDTGLVFRFVTTEGFFAEGYAVLAREKGFERAYVLAANNAAQLDAASSFEERFQAEGGEWVGTTIFEPGQASYQSEINQALDADPDIIMIASYTPEAITIARTLYQLDDSVEIVGPLYSLNASFIESVGADVAEGSLAVDAVSAIGTPAYESFAPRYAEAAGEDASANPYAVMTYDMIIVTALAVEAAGSTDAEVFVPFVTAVSNAPGVEVSTFADGLAALEAGEEIDYAGASSPIGFTEAGDLQSMLLRAFTIEGGEIIPGEILEP